MSLRVEAAGDAVVLTIDRPGCRNAIDSAYARRLGEAIRLAAADPRVRGVVITAEGSKIFVAGGDIRELHALASGGAGGDAVLSMFEGFSALEESEVPVVAAVQGDVLGGGCELLLRCDFVIVEEHVALSFRHVKMGLSPAWGGLTRLCERVGPLAATRLLLTAEKIDAAEALRIGLVNEVVPTGAARGRAIAQVNRIADNPRTTVAAMKRSLCKVREALRASAVEVERRAFAEQWNGPDHRRAMDAFLNRK
ncbi:enoyl-CoA hydratase [Sorangium cellulosum]|uniref:Enoyl-CoA hydratase n=1 Tax=Sorangium cellulosum TaxID=56 RepID=A0A4V0NEB1_SORCE|nr:enoyl-CoA hydratase/isomerase family protein [Sorangium cellulosum]AUX25552.1 enoyl-CoA hydratase [Sorangium cellulosum]